MDIEFEEELERRLTRMESPGGGGMLQQDLPKKDVLITIGVLVVASALLIWWAW